MQMIGVNLVSWTGKLAIERDISYVKLVFKWKNKEARAPLPYEGQDFQTSGDGKFTSNKVTYPDG